MRWPTRLTPLPAHRPARPITTDVRLLFPGPLESDGALLRLPIRFYPGKRSLPRPHRKGRSAPLPWGPPGALRGWAVRDGVRSLTPPYRPQNAPLTCTYSVRGRVRRQPPRPRPRHLPPHHRPRGRRKSAKNDPLRHFPLFYCANFSLFRAPSGPHRPEIAVTSKNARGSLLTLSRFSNVNQFSLLTLRFPTWENAPNWLTCMFLFDAWLTLAIFD